MNNKHSRPIPTSARRPEKIRRALSDLNGTEIYSPRNPQKDLTKMLQAPPPKIAPFTNNQRKSKLPVFTMSKAKREELRAMISGTHIESPVINEQKRVSTFTMKDPEAIKIRKEIEDKLIRMIEKEQQTLKDLEIYLKETKNDFQNLSKKISNLQNSIRSIKNQNDQNESTIITLDDKLYLQDQKINFTKIHEAKMATFKIQEEQNIIMRELDDMKLLLEEQLKNSKNYKDEESEREIFKFQQEILQLGNSIKILEESNQERLKNHKSTLELKFQEYIKQQELKNEQLTKNYEFKTLELEKLRDKLDKFKQQLKSLNSIILRVQDEIKEIEYLKKNSLSIESHLIQEINRLELEESKKLKDLTFTQTQNDQIDKQYQETIHRYTKEQTIRRKIENSIEELEGKLRVYVRITGNEKKNRISFDFNDELHQILKLSKFDKSFTVNKIIPFYSSNLDTYKELEVFIEKNLMNGINISIILIGFEVDYFLEDFIDEFKNLFEPKIIDIQIEKKSLSNLITIIIKFDNGKIYETKLNILNLTSSTFNSLIDTINSIKLDFLVNNKLTNESDIFHQLFSRSKCLTLLSIKDDEKFDDINIKILEIGDIISKIEALPLKKTYGKNFF